MITLTKDEILKKINEDKVKFIELQFSDIFGAMKAVTITVDELDSAIVKGKWFDGSSIRGFARLAESDMYLKPDLNTYSLIYPVNEELKTARFICDIYTPDGKPYEGDPRQILKREIENAEKLGFECMFGPEIEFFLLKSDDNGEMIPVPNDIGGYFDSSTYDKASEVRKKIMLIMEEMGWKAEVAHHEVAIGQHEIGFKYGGALDIADKIITLKQVIRSTAQKDGLHATFMPKPFFGVNGSGMHMHFSVMDKSGNPLFYDETDKYKLSTFGKNFMAGIMKHIKESCILFAPTTNSYKRLVPGYEAPVYICWGSTNRSSLVRVPKPFEGVPKSVRAELRCPDPSCNAYLAFATMIKTGLDGVANEERIADAVEESVFEYNDEKLNDLKIDTLPETLGEALENFKNSRFMLEFLGEGFFKKYYEAKKIEWDESKIQVTEWELDKYLDSA